MNSIRDSAPTSAGSERGQILVIVAVGLIALVAMVGLVVDGGMAWGEQRRTQNGTDAMALAGATVLAEQLAGVAKTSGDVGCALQRSAQENSVDAPAGVYTDINGTPLDPEVAVAPCSPGGGGAIPSTASGVRAFGEKVFATYLASVIGIRDMKAEARATAVAGVVTQLCPASEGCAVLPVTFPITAVICDGTNRQIQIGTAEWPLVTPDTANASNEVNIPLCSMGPGAVGWLDFGCAPNLAQTISQPCNPELNIPTWVHTQPGNTNSLDVELNRYAGPLLGVADDSIVIIPLNDNTCNTRPPDSQPDCPGGNGSGNGNNFYYHVPKFAGFMIDRAYTGGSNPAECNSAPGSPQVGGNGATGCIKGWFIRYITRGPVGAAGTGPQDPSLIGVQLVN